MLLLVVLPLLVLLEISLVLLPLLLPLLQLVLMEALQVQGPPQFLQLPIRGIRTRLSR